MERDPGALLVQVEVSEVSEAPEEIVQTVRVGPVKATAPVGLAGSSVLTGLAESTALAGFPVLTGLAESTALAGFPVLTGLAQSTALAGLVGLVELAGSVATSLEEAPASLG